MKEGEMMAERKAYGMRLKSHCKDRRPCFAREHEHCTILKQTYEEGICTFAKKKQSDKLSYFAAERKAQNE